ncbi:MAG: PASTA domain-containing protein [Bacteroidia bacterium]|nr:PASTA domain-containing protein [Bacteroidia bacterium]
MKEVNSKDNAIISRLKHWLKSIWLFLTSKEVVKNLLKMAALIAIFFFLAFKGLKLYTHHGQRIAVDNLQGLNVEDAKRLASENGFKVKVIDSLFLLDKKPNEVVSQNPRAGSFVKSNRTIYLTTTKASADLRTLPGLVGNYDYDQYAKKLTRLSIESSIKEKVYDGRQEPNSIVHLIYNGEKITQADLKSGYKVPMGSKVEAVVTYRYSTTTDAPDLVCMQVGAAEFLLESSDLRIGNIFTEGTITDQENAYIIRQYPEYVQGGLIEKGSPIDIFIQQAKPDKCQ